MTNKQHLLEQIKQSGYWEINIRPTKHDPKRLRQKEIMELIREANVGLRGWSYPVYGINNLKPSYVQDGVENAFSDGRSHEEVWRMTQSGNFFHLLKLHEDGYEQIPDFAGPLDQGNNLQDQKWLGVFNTLYLVTEIFEFAQRVSSNARFDNLVIDITLHGIEGRILLVDSPQKMSFSSKYQCSTPKWNYRKKFGSVEKFQQNPHTFSFEAFKKLMILFQWDTPPVESLKSEQRKLLEGKI